MPQLILPSSLYGREEEIGTLDEALNRCKDDSGQFTIVTGSGGSGKSSLVQSFAKGHTRDTLCSAGKFCAYRREPYSAVVDGMYALCCDSLLKTTEGQRNLLGALEKVSLDESILKTVLPKLYQVVASENDNKKANATTSNFKTENNVARLHSAFFNLLRSLCSPSRPIIIFLDDVHWADEASLDLVYCLADNINQLPGLLMVVAYRNDEVDADRPLSLRLTDMKSHDGVTCIQVTNITLEATNLLLAETVGRGPTETMPLAQVLHQKTGGNPFYMRRALQSLERNGHLYFSTSSFKWEWREVRRLSREMSISDNVVELVASTMKELPEETQEALKIASCLGAQFRTSVLAEYFRRYPCNDYVGSEENAVCSRVSIATEEHVDEILEVALEEDLLLRRPCSATYLWSHDKLLQAAHSLVPEGKERAILHWRLGNLLREMSIAHPEQQWMLFLAADQLNRGSSLIPDECARVALAKLNLDASKLSGSKSAYYPAATLLRKGIDIIKPNLCWTPKNYELSLQLYNSLAEIEFVLGNHCASKQAVEEVITNARCAEDTFHVQTVFIRSLGAQRKFDEAINASYSALESYGMNFPKHPSIVQVRLESFRMEREFGNGGLERILGLPTMTDDVAIRQSELIYLLSFFSTLSGRKNTTAIAALRGIRLAYSKGLNGILASCFGEYSMFLSMSRKTERACMYCDIAIKLFAIIGEKSLYARLLSGLQSVVIPLKRSFHESLEPYMEVYRVGVECGDLEYGLTGALWYCVCYLLMGLPLAPVVSDLRGFIDQTSCYQLPSTLRQTFQIQYQMVLNLQGEALDDPTVLIGDAMDQQAALEGFEGRALWSVKRDIFTARIQLAYIYGDLEVGKEMMTELKVYPNDFVVARQYLRDSYTALFAFALARLNCEKKYLKQGRKLLKKFERQTKQGSLNAYPIYMLLKAENGSIDKDAEGVKSLYDDAIKICARSGLIHLAAVASEQLGRYFLEKDDKSLATLYLSDALDLYDDWGASGKVLHMKKHYGKLLSESDGMHKSTSLKARERCKEEDSYRLKTFDLDSGDFSTVSAGS